MNNNAPKCKKCKIPFNNEDHRPITIVCGDTLCEQCYDSSLLDNGKQIKCPVDGNIYHLIGKKIYDEAIIQQVLIQSKFFVFCDLHSLEPADYYYKVDDKLMCYKCLAQGGYDSDQFQHMGNGKLEKLGDELYFRLDAFFEQFKLIQKQLSELKNRKDSVSAKRMMEIVKVSQGLFARNDWETDFISQFGFKSDSKTSNKDQPRLLDKVKEVKEEIKHQPEDNHSQCEKQRQELSFQYESQLKIVQDQCERIAYQKDYEIQSLKQEFQLSLAKSSQQKDQDIQRLQQDLQKSTVQISQLKEECDMLQNSLNSNKQENEAFPLEMKSELEKRIEDLEKIKKIMDEALEHKDMTNKRLNEQIDQLQNQRLKDQQNYVLNQSKVKESLQYIEEIAKLTEQLDINNDLVRNLQVENEILMDELKESQKQTKMSKPKDENADQKVSQLFGRIEELEKELHDKNDYINSLLSAKFKVEEEQKEEIKILRQQVEMLQSELFIIYENADDKGK